MRTRPRLLGAASLLWCAHATLLFGCGSDTAPELQSTSSCASSGAGGSDLDPEHFISPPPPSCAYDCGAKLAGCDENTVPYACPTLDEWTKIPHAPACGCWDQKPPVVTQGACTASAPVKDALKRTGADPDDPTAFLLPDGRRIHPAGHEWILQDLPGGMTSAVIDVPGSGFALTVDTGFGDHAVRALDVAKLGTGVDPVASIVKIQAPETLNSGIVFVPPGHVFVATANGLVQALTLDPATGVLARDDANSIALPDPKTYVAGLAVSPDGTKLVVSQVQDTKLLVYSCAVAALDYGKLLGTLDLGGDESFTVAFDPNDPSGASAYVSLWSGKRVLAVDLSNAASPVIKATYATDRNPEGIAFLSARFMAVASAFGEALAIVDRMSGEVTSVPVDVEPSKLHGGEPTLPVYDAASKRLYLVLAGVNAVAAYDVDLSGAKPKLTRLGWFGTAWWPSGVAVRADGSLVVTTLRGHGGGPIPEPFPFGDNDIGDRMRASVALVPAPTPAELTAGEDQAKKDLAVGDRPGAPAITCPPGTKSDFPVPATNTEGPSPKIDHVFFILRENKNFDAILGDLAGVEGEPKYTLRADTKDMDAIWRNFRKAARAFTVGDNYYTDAVFSTQGHVWATYGRTSDFNERTWAISGPRSSSPRAVPGGGVIDVGRPTEGSLFDWLFANKVPFDIMGEIDGQPDLPPGTKAPLDIKYPGVGQAITLNDLPKACYAAGRVRVTCDLGNFVYQTLPNDHTVGVSSSHPLPEVMCAVNDEATGMMLDAISHSPHWKSSLVVITEDDPSSGGEHVDCHRTPLVLVSPWVKRGYVSKTHVDIASIHKLYAHVFGIPYPNVAVADAMLPFDAFTSTPDFTPFDHEARTWPLACGSSAAPPGAGGEAGSASSSAEEELTSLWDFDEEDRQPGLGAQVWRSMRRRPLGVVTPAMRGTIERWKARAERAAPED